MYAYIYITTSIDVITFNMCIGSLWFRASTGSTVRNRSNSDVSLLSEVLHSAQLIRYPILQADVLQISAAQLETATCTTFQTSSAWLFEVKHGKANLEIL